MDVFVCLCRVLCCRSVADRVLKVLRSSAENSFNRLCFCLVCSDLLPPFFSCTCSELVPLLIFPLSCGPKNFLLSASMDQTVRLWHLSKNECLRKFEHLDIVSTVRFNPLDNTIFLSCAFNGTVHLWSILKNAYLSTVSAEDYVTCSAISHDGKLAMVGTVHGHVKLYSVHNEISGQWKLKEITQIDIRPERSKDVKTNAEEALVKNKSRKVTGIEISPSGKEVCDSTNHGKGTGKRRTSTAEQRVMESFGSDSF